MKNIYVVMSKYNLIWRIFTNEKLAIEYKIRVSNKYPDSKPFTIYKFYKSESKENGYYQSNLYEK